MTVERPHIAIFYFLFIAFSNTRLVLKIGMCYSFRKKKREDFNFDITCIFP